MDNIRKVTLVQAWDIAEIAAKEDCEAETREEMAENIVNVTAELCSNKLIAPIKGGLLVSGFGALLQNPEPPPAKDISDLIIQFLEIDDGEDDLQNDIFAEILNEVISIKELLKEIKQGLEWLTVKGGE